jgi:hypothetical protein
MHFRDKILKIAKGRRSLRKPASMAARRGRTMMVALLGVGLVGVLAVLSFVSDGKLHVMRHRHTHTHAHAHKRTCAFAHTHWLAVLLLHALHMMNMTVLFDMRMQKLQFTRYWPARTTPWASMSATGEQTTL